MKPLFSYVIVFIALGVSSLASGQGLSTSEVDQLMDKWLAIESQTSQIKSRWIEQKPLIEQRIAILKAEKSQLSGILTNSAETSTEVEQRRAELLVQQDDLEQQQAITDTTITALKNQLDALYLRLPPPLKDNWQDETDASEENRSAVFQQQLSRLSRLQEFNDRISIHSMRLENDQQEPIMVKQLYLGLSQAWFVSQNGEYRGYGRVENGEWQWSFDQTLNANEIQRAIAIVENRSPKQPVDLPIYALRQEASQ